MSVEHLMGKRTGRRHGSKNRPEWVRAVRWAYAHLDDEGAVPPSPLAGLLLEIGRREPDRLCACLAVADAASVPKGEAPQGRRLLRVSLSLGGLPLLQAAALPSWRAALPQQYEFVGLALDLREERVVLTIRSDQLAPVPEDQPVPLVRLDR
jgi:hypothetical protein